MTPQLLNFDASPVASETRPTRIRRSRRSEDADFFAAFFRHRPNTWISALELMNERACLSFRTRLSDLRYPPYAMDIQNRQEVVQGKRYSFYRYVPEEGK